MCWAAAALFINQQNSRHHPQKGDGVKRMSFEEWPLKAQSWLLIKLVLKGHENPQAARCTQKPLGLGWRLGFGCTAGQGGGWAGAPGWGGWEDIHES